MVEIKFTGMNFKFNIVKNVREMLSNPEIQQYYGNEVKGRRL